jgi:hypothetical protein
LKTPTRQRTRIVPPAPITVAIADRESGLCLCYGVIANVSEDGACVWTSGALEPGSRLLLRVSFAFPPEVHEVTGVVIWGKAPCDGGPVNAPGLRRFGVEWQDAPSACVERLRTISLRALEDSLTPSGRMRSLLRAELES